jgi:hypothetical protein
MNNLYKNIIVTIVILFIYTSLSAQTTYLKGNEAVLFSFKTASGKTLMLALDTANKYIVYRYGTAKHIEFEYPKDTVNSFDNFKRFYYVRYGGYPNAGTEISQVEFTNQGFTYKLYDQSFTLDEGYRSEIGVTIQNNKTNKETQIKGLVKTQKGSLIGLKESETYKAFRWAFRSLRV